MNPSTVRSSAPPRTGSSGGQPRAKEPLLDIRSRIEGLAHLPPMPEMAQKIIRLSSNPDAQAKELVGIVELDPGLAATVIRYARSPFFSFRGKIDSVFTAVTRVLGYHTVMNLALGATAARSFKIPRQVPLGLDAFWRHAVYTAALSQALSAHVDPEQRPPGGLAYLAGLLHNIGHLVLGHLFRPEFLILNKHIAAEPERPVVAIEHEVLGMDHSEIGAILAESWRLPEEIVIAIRHHHDPGYSGIHAVYPQLVLLSDGLLRMQGIGEGELKGLAAPLLEGLGISEYQATALVNRVFEDNDGLESMARQFAS